MDCKYHYQGIDVSDTDLSQLFERIKQSLYKSKKVQIPIPELYVIYTGDRKTKPSEISLSKEFFDGKECCLDVKVKMIYDGKEGDIINQYVIFTKVCNEQMKKYGRILMSISFTSALNSATGCPSST